MTSATSLVCEPSEKKILWCPPDATARQTQGYDECPPSFDDNGEHREYKNLTQLSSNPSTIIFKESKIAKQKTGDDVALAIIFLGGGFILGGPIGLGVGALLLTGCYGVEDVGIANGGGFQNDMSSSEIVDAGVNRNDSRNGVEVTEATVISRNTTSSPDPSIAWTGREYGISWLGKDNSSWQVFFTRLGRDGHQIGNEEQMTSASFAAYGSFLTWNESMRRYALAWENYHTGIKEIFFMTIDETGNKVGNDISLISENRSAVAPFVVWNNVNNEYGMSWVDDASGDSRIKFTRIDSSGNRIDPMMAVNSRLSLGATMIWNGSEYGLNWMEEFSNDCSGSAGSEIKFRRLDSQGNSLGVEESLAREECLFNDAGNLFSGSMAWTGNEYGIAWYNANEQKVYFERINENGGQVGSPAPIADATTSTIDNPYEGALTSWVVGSPSLVWNGGEYGISWAGAQGSNQGIHFARLDQNGNRIGDVLQVTSNERSNNSSPVSDNPFLVWTGQDYGTLWTQWANQNYELQFARITGNFNR